MEKPVVKGVCEGCQCRHLLVVDQSYCRWCAHEQVCEKGMALCEFCDCERHHHLHGRCTNCSTCIGFLENASEREYSYWSYMARAYDKKATWGT